jgi:HAD superfamily hydrolase (TIGR01484 family)
VKPLTELSNDQLAQVRYVFADIDDTLTTHGKLTSEAYAALESLNEAGFVVVPITGRPAGWCDMIARFWPVDAVVGENGAFYMRMPTSNNRHQRLQVRHVADEASRAMRRTMLDALAQQILRDVPGCALASDQAFRFADLAIDFCEDVPDLGLEGAQRIHSLMATAGLTAKISSIHVNGWFGDYDKLSTTALMVREVWNSTLIDLRDQCIFVGDSPNDSPMFEFFPLSVAVANALPLIHLMPAAPQYITTKDGGAGFAQVAQALLRARTTLVSND